MGGGGGNTTTQTSGVPEWLRPDVQRAFGRATAAHGDGELSKVAGVNADTLEVEGPEARALAEQEALASDAISGQGLYDTRATTERDLQNLAGANLAGRAGSGTLGSARADRAQQAALADRALQHQVTAQQNAGQGVQALRDAGKYRTDAAQRQADATHQGLQRLFGYYGSGAAGTTTSQSGGGGK